jgi:spermine synthase
VLAESDLIYSHTLLNLPEEDFCGKTVLILGGGDGGLLHELLKLNPRFVTMAEVSFLEVVYFLRAFHVYVSIDRCSIVS